MLHPLNITNINNYYNYKLRFDGAFLRNNLSRTRNGVYVINLDNEKSKRTHWVLLLIDINTIVYFDSFGIEYIEIEIESIKQTRR